MYFIFLLLFVCFVSLWLGFQKALPERSWWTSWWELRGGGGGRGGRGGGGGGSRWLQFAVFVDAIGWTFLLTGSKEKKKRMSKGKGKLQAPEAYTTPATPATPVTPPLESQQTCFCLFVLWIYPCRLLFSYFSFSFLPPPFTSDSLDSPDSSDFSDSPRVSVRSVAAGGVQVRDAGDARSVRDARDARDVDCGACNWISIGPL